MYSLLGIINKQSKNWVKIGNHGMGKTWLLNSNVYFKIYETCSESKYILLDKIRVF